MLQFSAMQSKERQMPYFHKILLFLGMLLIASSCAPIESYAQTSKHTLSICIDGPDKGIYCGGKGDDPIRDFPVTIFLQNGGSLIKKTDGNGEVTYDPTDYETGFSVDTDALREQIPMCDLFYALSRNKTSIACSLAGSVSL